MLKPLRVLFSIGAMCLLSGCLGLLAEAVELRGLMALGGRGLAGEIGTASIFRMAGGARAFAARAVSTNVGAAIAVDDFILSGGSRAIPITVRRGGMQTIGRVFVDDMRTVRVRMGANDIVKIVRAERTAAADGLTARHYSSAGEMISYTRYSPDKLRFDYFAKFGEGQYRPVVYGLRSPASGDVTLFGPNHRYLGRATYRTPSGRVPLGALAVASAASVKGLIVTVDDYDDQATDDFRLCSEHYLLLRQTHFQQNWDRSTPVQFWQSMYADCPKDRMVVLSVRRVLLDDAVAEKDRTAKLRKLDAIRQQFPEFDEARLIREQIK